MKARFLWMLLIASHCLNLFSQDFSIKSIGSLDINQEKELIAKSLQSLFGVHASSLLLDQMVSSSFQIAEEDCLDQTFNKHFFHVVVDDQVIADTSYELLDDYHIHICLIINPELFTVDIVKEILFKVIKNHPNIKTITISCLSGLIEMENFLKSIGFIRLEPSLRQVFQLCSTYEMKLNSKCKICELVYPNMWSDELDDDIETQEDQEEDLRD